MEIDKNLLMAMVGIVGKKKTDEIIALAKQIKEEAVKVYKPSSGKAYKYKHMRRII